MPAIRKRRAEVGKSVLGASVNLLANENFPRAAVEALRSAGHDVLWARTDMAGCADEEILARARLESRVLITFDKDFGELAYRSGMPATCGVILFRLVLSSPEFVAKRAVAMLQSRDDWRGQFAVADEVRIRLRPLPELPVTGTDSGT